MFVVVRRSFNDLSSRDVLALAIGAEEEDAHHYRDMADRLESDFPASARVFSAMAVEEDDHRRMLIDLYKEKHGLHIPRIRRDDVAGFMRHPPIWSMKSVTVEGFSRRAAEMEEQAAGFYRRAAEGSEDADVRRLLGDLAAMEEGHGRKAEALEARHLDDDANQQEEQTKRRLFVLQIVQPGLAGLIDGTISTLAPIFAAAFATQNSWSAFLVGLAASIGAGISMGLTEALSDDGAITGRGQPWLRGLACGLMTALGGLGHTVPFLIPHFWTAIAVAAVIVGIELMSIAWIRWRYMETPIISATLQVIMGGALVLLAGILIGSA